MSSSIKQVPINNPAHLHQRQENLIIQGPANDKLPLEILCLIAKKILFSPTINHKEKEKALCNFRLVCKNWDAAIQSVLFQKKTWDKIFEIRYISKSKFIRLRWKNEMLCCLPSPFRPFISLSRAIASPHLLLTPSHFKQHIEQIDTSLAKIRNSSPTLNAFLSEANQNDTISIHNYLLNPKISSPLSSITDLSLKELHLQFLPPEIAFLSSLQKLDLSKNQFQVLPVQMGELSHLKTFDLSHNRITEIPDQISHLASVEVLDFSHNKIAKISSKIFSLSQLASLNLSNNQITEIPNGKIDAPSLILLNLTSNKIETLSRPFFQIISQSTFVTLDGNPIDQTDHEVAKLFFTYSFLTNDDTPIYRRDYFQLAYISQIMLRIAYYSLRGQINRTDRRVALSSIGFPILIGIVSMLWAKAFSNTPE